MRIYDVIAKKRDGGELNNEELAYFIKGSVDGSIADYQIAAMLMAMFIRGMTENETVNMTMLMARSGHVPDLSGIDGIIADKHSTGGVGDKTTLVVCPIMAACGLKVAKMSGRGLGHTGGTIDKLESIPGFRTQLKTEEFIENVKKIGIAVAGATGDIAPADKKFYAVRDLTATIDSIPLIACSIMSKKIASGAQKIVLDVKTGSGAFIHDVDKSIELASEMVRIGLGAGVDVCAAITDMDVPLGYAIGNSVEVIEAIETLKGRGPADLMEVSVELAAMVMEMSGMGSMQECKEKSIKSIENGSALAKLSEMISAQSGDWNVINNYSLFGKAAFSEEITARETGYFFKMETAEIGVAANMLGAGRNKIGDPVDHTAGIILKAKTGDKVAKGDIIAIMLTNKIETFKPAAELLLKAISVSSEAPETKPLIYAHVRKDLSVEKYT